MSSAEDNNLDLSPDLFGSQDGFGSPDGSSGLGRYWNDAVPHFPSLARARARSISPPSPSLVDGDGPAPVGSGLVASSLAGARVCVLT